MFFSSLDASFKHIHDVNKDSYIEFKVGIEVLVLEFCSFKKEGWYQKFDET